MLTCCVLCIFLRNKVIIFLYRFKKTITWLIILKSIFLGFNLIWPPWVFSLDKDTCFNLHCLPVSGLSRLDHTLSFLVYNREILLVYGMNDINIFTVTQTWVTVAAKVTQIVWLLKSNKILLKWYGCNILFILCFVYSQDHSTICKYYSQHEMIVLNLI